jgi:dolichol kinase
MVSGIVCVGMGDAAASLVGRRYGRLKWFWGGGKSLEGSLAFTIAVFVGLMVARIWLTVGGWAAVSSASFIGMSSWGFVAVKCLLAAGGASLTEAVLTGGNDNVIVPVVLWLLVRGLAI